MSRRVWLLDSLRVEQAGEALSLSGSKLVNLFTFLILHPNTTHRRERLADLLFPDASPERALRNLSALLYRLRQLLGAAWFETTEEHIALRTGADLWVDVWEFERLTENGDLAALQSAV